MEALKLLRRQVKAMWKLEEEMMPDKRRNHSWQFVARQSGVPYLVGKGDANTFFYRVGEKGELTYGPPDEVFAVLDKWVGEHYVMYGILRKRDWSKALHQTKTIDALLQKMGSKYVGRYIVGLKPDGKLVRLYQLRGGLMGNQWVPIKPKVKK